MATRFVLVVLGCTGLVVASCGSTSVSTPVTSTAPATTSNAAPTRNVEIGSAPGMTPARPWDAHLGPGCRRVAPTEALVSGTYSDAVAARAMDQDATTMWNSGGHPPQQIALDLGAARAIRGIVVIAAMTPDGDVTHILDTSWNGTSYETRQTFQGHMGERDITVLRLPRPVLARSLRLRTTQSPSWVAWYEVVPFACDGDPPPDPGAP